MKNYIEIKDFCENDNHIPLELIDDLTILTGDNGAGKTTLLNLIFSVLNGDLENLFKSNFTSINVNLDVPKDNKENVHKIKVIKGNGYIEVTYFLYKTRFKIKITKHKYKFFNTTYELLSPKKEEKEERIVKKENDLISYSKFWIDTEAYCGTLQTLIDKYPELEFINEIKKCLIYFPTYRRIDTDIIELLEQNYEINKEIEFGEVRKIFKDFPMRNRIVGVNDEDIDHLFKIYSDESRKMNSEGLDNLLKRVY